jgi:putative two-component system response regulator
MPFSDIGADLYSSRILVVDDTSDNLELIDAMLDGEGYRSVVCMSDPKAALRLYLDEAFDLVLLDLNMPGLDGHGFIAAAAPTRPPATHPIIVLTAQTDRANIERALSAGVRDYMTKPIEVTEVLHRVRNVLATHLLHNRTRELNRELDQRVRSRTAELESTRRELIQRLSTASEFRDNETGQHVIRMSHFAHQLALAAGLDPAEADMVRDAAPLHDIGKIGIPDRILLKPGPLDADEWATMRRHTEIGGAILGGSGFPLLELARTIALTHHEKWDGSGYPGGLAGEDIPISGRIVAVADVFDALTSVRPYKRAWTTEEAVGHLRGCAGQHLDAGLVELFLGELPVMLEIRQRFADA